LGDAESPLVHLHHGGVVTSDVGNPLSTSRDSTLRAVVTVVVLLLVFLVGIKGMGDGFKLLGKDALDSFFRATSNPFMGLVVGILATTLVQSSSVSTSMIVGLVASPESPLPIANAIPMVMGANIGTTVTNTIVSLAHMGRRDEFERAFSVATCHDFFNFLAVAVFLPLEITTGVFQKLSGIVVGQIGGLSGADYQSPLKGAISLVLKPIKAAIESLVTGPQTQGLVLVLVSGGLIFVALFLLVRTMRGVVQTRVEVYITRFLGSSVVLAVAVGVAVTVMVQSSSITTALLVPLAGAGLLTTRQAFPVTVGANIGTTITALLAALAVSGPNASAGLQIAVVHLLFNMSATFLILPVPAIRDIPIHAAERLARVAARSRPIAIAYVTVLFYGIPALLAYLSNLFDQ
jgi:sodium-dependent phosphate cotransporter